MFYQETLPTEVAFIYQQNLTLVPIKFFSKAGLILALIIEREIILPLILSLNKNSNFY
jgi:hypothetical protein